MKKAAKILALVAGIGMIVFGLANLVFMFRGIGSLRIYSDIYVVKFVFSLLFQIALFVFLLINGIQSIKAFSGKLVLKRVITGFVFMAVFTLVVMAAFRIYYWPMYVVLPFMIAYLVSGILFNNVKE